eukprot:TRINITY_DN4611_c0_g1_i2.p1 TRINITY_DN4611_c0_g1~~TRINITY_DN4611_c0_g1_i2.p1  ORF type:complete len:339 (-),score=95.45 TRINITY_DN4611_c0_g1_i2:253-1269(-)
MGICGSKNKTDSPRGDRPKSTAPEKKPASPPPTEVKKEQPPPAEKKPDPPKEDREEDVAEDSDVSVKEGLEDHYVLGPEIGRGGFSVVVSATEKSSGRKVAVKCIQLDVQDADAVKGLKREIKIMKKIDHPNILKLYDVYVEGSDFYLVMELVPGKELFERIIEKGQYSEKHASIIIRQILSAVDYLHGNGIAHRDLKPENLLSSGDGDEEVVKIIDFGLSKKFGDEKLVTSVGSPGYVAPEVLTDDSYDKSVDMWSVGVILYILLSGYPPFFGDTSSELFKKIIDCNYDFDDPAWDNVSEPPKNLIRQLLVKDPSKRLTAKQMYDHDWVQGKGLPEK